MQNDRKETQSGQIVCSKFVSLSSVGVRLLYRRGGVGGFCMPVLRITLPHNLLM